MSMGQHWFESGEFDHCWRFETEIVNSFPDLDGIDDAMEPARAWCTEQFGCQPTTRWTSSLGLIWIYNAVDATAFKLRWC